MTKPPDFSLRWISDAKVRDYLLSRASQKGRSRHDFFIRFGFHPGRWETLRDALMQHLAMAEVKSTRRNELGEIYSATGPLSTPDGRNPVVVAFWIIPPADPRPWLTSVVPYRSRTRPAA